MPMHAESRSKRRWFSGVISSSLKHIRTLNGEDTSVQPSDSSCGFSTDLSSPQGACSFTSIAVFTLSSCVESLWQDRRITLRSSSGILVSQSERSSGYRSRFSAVNTILTNSLSREMLLLAQMQLISFCEAESKRETPRMQLCLAHSMRNSAVSSIPSSLCDSSSQFISCSSNPRIRAQPSSASTIHSLPVFS